jgi:hypothetical protein
VLRVAEGLREEGVLLKHHKGSGLLRVAEGLREEEIIMLL